MRSITTLLLSLFLTPAALADTKAPNFAERLEKTRTDLKSTDVEVRRTAIKSLVHSDLSEKLSEPMQAMLKDSDGEVCATAATAIGNLGAHGVPAVPTLIAQLQNDPMKEARETAARALGRIGKAAPKERRAVEPLRDAAVKDSDAVTRTVALGALAMMGIDIPGQVVALQKFLKNADPLVRMKAAHALGMIGTASKATSPDIAAVLEQSKDVHHRGYIARALGSVGDPKALPVLYKALEKETDPGCRGEMQGAISRLGGKVPQKK